MNKSFFLSDRGGFDKWLFWPTIFIFFIIGLLASLFNIYKIHSANREHFLDRVSSLTIFFTADDLAKLSGTANDLNNPDYIKVKKQLVDLREYNHDVRFIYLVGIKKGRMFFYADSEDPNSKDYSAPGDPYDEATHIMKDVIEKNTNGFEFASDQWGSWVSAYAPIRDKNGNAVALVGSDENAKEYILDMVAYGSFPLLLTLLIISFIILSHRMRLKEKMYLDQKADFLSIASHEIRTPLTGIRWGSELLIESDLFKTANSEKSLIEQIHGNCVNLINRINNLLSMNSIEGKNAYILNINKVYTKPIISEVVESLRLFSKSRTIELKIDSSITESVSNNIDVERFRQVMTNLISNAVKYAKHDSTITISYIKQGEYDGYVVRNEGEKIPDDELIHLFERYHRAKVARESATYGTGIGLYLSQEIAKLHDGRIEVSSDESGVTKFTFFIPS